MINKKGSRKRHKKQMEKAELLILQRRIADVLDAEGWVGDWVSPLYNHNRKRITTQMLRTNVYPQFREKFIHGLKIRGLDTEVIKMNQTSK